MEKVSVCTCWDVDGGVCEVHRLRDMTDCEVDWDKVYDFEFDQEDIDFDQSYYDYSVDDELPF